MPEEPEELEELLLDELLLEELLLEELLLEELLDEEGFEGCDVDCWVLQPCKVRSEVASSAATGTAISLFIITLPCRPSYQAP